MYPCAVGRGYDALCAEYGTICFVVIQSGKAFKDFFLSEFLCCLASEAGKHFVGMVMVVVVMMTAAALVIVVVIIMIMVMMLMLMVMVVVVMLIMVVIMLTLAIVIVMMFMIVITFMFMLVLGFFPQLPVLYRACSFSP